MPGLIKKNKWTIIYWVFCILTVPSFSQSEKDLPVYRDENGTLKYKPDERGDRIPDFSFCGYMASEREIPNVPVKVFIPATSEDASEKIRKAIDYVSKLPLDENGFRGAILLDKGIFKIKERLNINTSGIVLRGTGIGDEGTILIAAGTDRETLIKISGKYDLITEPEIKIFDPYVPVNSTELKIGNDHSLKEGDKVMLFRPTTQEWIDALSMRSFGGKTEWLGWKPGRDRILWDRVITATDEQSITLNAPLTTALDTNYGGGYLLKYTWPGRISNVGIENMILQSEYDTINPKDEEHCWMAITIENAKDCWARQLTFKNFAGSAVAIFESAKQVTVEDCISVNPVSEIGGHRRNTYFTSGQQTLFQRCYAENGYHDFAVGNFAPGPNAFVQCESHFPHSFSGTIDRWASGVLFDLVYIDGNAISLKNRMQEAQGAGWTAANSMIWQSYASLIECYSPPTATNWAFGTWGEFAGNGFWHEANSHIKPKSLFYAQLADRIGEEALDRSFLLPIVLGSTSSPSADLAKKLSDSSTNPHIQLFHWIESAAGRNPIPSTFDTVMKIDEIGNRKETNETNSQVNIGLENGLLVTNHVLVSGHITGVRWWNGTARPYGASKAGPHITRFVPGRTGLGYTDDLDEVTDLMLKNNLIAINHNYGLWYDRRRDDHEMIRRIDGDVWPPFYELPFARSGLGTSWDGLSKYDLTEMNIWYWSRLKEFADLADRKGLLLIHQNYFQHNILEAGAHWADFPWRSANNINNTGFPEPPPYAGHKRIYMASQFYDITNPERRELHKQYIRQCLSNFSDNSNVIQFISAEYTGPLHFVEFWIDVIIEWEKETGKDVLVGLSTTKDVQDAILSDPVRSGAIEIIEIRYWQYRDDGSLYAPEGGKNLAPRQHARLVKSGKPTFESVYRAVFEYRSAYPEKAVMYSNRIDKKYQWAVFMAGGSVAGIPKIENHEFIESASQMIPVSSEAEHQFILANSKGEQIIYGLSPGIISIDLKNFSGTFSSVWINPENGSIIKQDKIHKGGMEHSLENPTKNDAILWIVKDQ